MGKKDKKKRKKEKASKEKFKKHGKGGSKSKGTDDRPEKKRSEGKRDFKAEIRRLEQEIEARDRLIQRLQQQEVPSEFGKRGAGDTLSKGVKRQPGQAVRHRKAWERHRYLRSQYEHYLEGGSEKSQARSLADRDLRSTYGEQAGYTPEQLDEILT